MNEKVVGHLRGAGRGCANAPEVYMYTLLHRHYQHPSAWAETPQTTPFYIDIFYISHHNRDLERRTRTGFKFDFFFRLFSRNSTPEGFIVFFSPEKLAQLFLLKKVSKFSHERLDTNLFPFPLKLVVEWWRLSRFPAKMTLAHARALLENLVLEVVLFLESKAKVSIISHIPNHSPSSGSSSIYDGDGSPNVTQKDNSRCFKPLAIHSISLSNIGEFFSSWILNDCV